MQSIIMERKILKGKKGFTLIEIIVVIVIIGILACIAIPNYCNFMEQGRAQAACNNMLTMYAAQRNYYFKTGCYYAGYSSTNNPCFPSNDVPDDINSLNIALSLNIPDDKIFKYQFVYIPNVGGLVSNQLRIYAYRGIRSPNF